MRAWWLAAYAACAVLIVGCASSFCGAPCESPPARDPSADAVNPYETVYGRLDIQAMTPAQLLAEKTDLETALSASPRDAEILKELQGRGDDSLRFDYEDNSAGGTKFRANGKLRREVGVEDVDRRVPIRISESPNRELFERYKRVRLRLRSAAGAALVAPPKDTVAAVPPPPDSLWSGFYRAGGKDSVASPEKFRSAGDCGEWAEAKARGLRQEAFSFEYACSRGGESMRRKLW